MGARYFAVGESRRWKGLWQVGSEWGWAPSLVPGQSELLQVALFRSVLMHKFVHQSSPINFSSADLSISIGAAAVLHRLREMFSLALW